MSFFAGAVGAFEQRRREADAQNRLEVDRQNEVTSKIAQRLLEDDDPEIQMHGLSILQQAVQPGKKRRGLAGFLGEYQKPEGLDNLLQFANTMRGAPGKLQETPPAEGSAALPATSPTTGGPAPRPQPSMLSSAVSGGAKFGSPSPASPIGGATPPDFNQAGAATASEVPGARSFGGINFGEPGMGTPAAQTPAVNIAAIASRVSRDGGVPQPGERARMFFPSAARLASQKTKSELLSQAEVLQSLGATPMETRRAMMAKMGASGGQPNVTQAGYAKLADGRLVQTFTYEEAGVPPRLVYSEGGSFAPLPPDAQSTRMAGAGAGGSQTSRMTGQQAIDFGIATAEDGLDPNGYYSVKQQGDTIQILPATKPIDPFAVQRGPGLFTPGMDRNGQPVSVPQPTANPRVAAAKAFIKAYQAIPAMMRTTQGQRQRAIQQELAKFPVLQGLTPGQVEALAGADDYLPEAEAARLLQSIGGTTPQANRSLTAPPTAGGSDPNSLPPDWADKLAATLLQQAGGKKQ